MMLKPVVKKPPIVDGSGDGIFAPSELYVSCMLGRLELLFRL